jgi:hypothetical protein
MNGEEHVLDHVVDAGGVSEAARHHGTNAGQDCPEQLLVGFAVSVLCGRPPGGPLRRVGSAGLAGRAQVSQAPRRYRPQRLEYRSATAVTIRWEASYRR